MRRFLFDTGVFVYALGDEHRYREPCRAILREVQSRRLAAEASVELIHEFAYVRLRRLANRADAARSAHAISRSLSLHTVERGDIERALDLWSEHAQLDVRDAIFAAQALNRGIEAILSPDGDFDGIPGLQRIDPADAQAVATLR
ncbi:MAG TPA: type II toxin-antitoxin system VapC family toxin [Solirubrobacteraceae bacterium]|nr:type II toxin-antitoxin system VapC family toxin [Solirubrobacteraceae bacterium]